MNPIKFSISKDANDPLDPFVAMLAPFTQTHGNPVELRSIPWEHYKQEITAMALYGQDVDVSQVGAPMVSALAAMNSLRRFTYKETISFGSGSAFVPVAWNRVLSADEAGSYAVPWVVDPRAVVYWRDMLADSGVDETTAFASFENMEQTFERLQETGFQTPWGIGTASSLSAFQVACTWIWGLGGEIGTEDQILFDRPEAIEALARYFSMYRFMPQAGHNPEAVEVNQWFKHRRVAAMITNPLAVGFSQMTPETRAKIGVALAPGPTYVGGSSLVVWGNTRQPDDAVALVRYLTAHETQLELARLTGFFPARSSALNDRYFSEDPHLSVFVQSFFKGRTYVNMRMSGLIEDILSSVISRIWSKIIADPHIDIKAALVAELEPIVRRVGLWSKSSR